MTDTAWPRKMGEAVAVDTNYMRQIYLAAPERGLARPAARVNAYLRALQQRGMTIKEWCNEKEGQ